MKKLTAIASALATVAVSGAAFAQTAPTPTTFDGSSVFSKVDLTAFSGNVEGIIAVAVGIAVLFVGFGVLKRGLGRI